MYYRPTTPILLFLAAHFLVHTSAAPTDVCPPSNTDGQLTDSKVLTCTPRDRASHPQALVVEDCNIAAEQVAQLIKPEYFRLTTTPPAQKNDVRAPLEQVVGGCLARLDLNPGADNVQVIKTLVHFGLLATVQDCVWRPNWDGGKFNLSDEQAFVEIKHAAALDQIATA